MSETPAVYETKQVLVLTDDIVKKYICPAATEQERYMFLQLCKGQALNPFLREAYLIKYGTSPATMVVGKDTFIKRARRIESYRGFKAGIVIISNKAVVYREGGMLIKGEELIGGWSEVYRSDLDVPVRSEVSLEEYIGKKKIWENNKVVGEEVNAQWTGKPATMIRKVALVQAHREAFPDQFEGLYSGEEMGIDVEAIPDYKTDKPAEGYKTPMQPPAEKKQEGEADRITEPQKKAIFAIFGKLEIKDDQLKHNYIGMEILGGKEAIKSVNDLTKEQAGTVIKYLAEKAEQKEKQKGNSDGSLL